MKLEDLKAIFLKKQGHLHSNIHSIFIKQRRIHVFLLQCQHLNTPKTAFISHSTMVLR